jgi:hypothetical protein
MDDDLPNLRSAIEHINHTHLQHARQQSETRGGKETVQTTRAANHVKGPLDDRYDGGRTIARKGIKRIVTPK